MRIKENPEPLIAQREAIKAQLREGDLKQLSQKLNIKYGVIRIFFTDSEVEGRARWITYFAYKKAEEILNAVENEIKSWNRN